jgi:microsomal dipeptidase-like Zn-dependent dipeptidase
MSEQTRPGETRFQAGIVVDTHIHTVDYLPAFALSTFRWFIRRTVPPLFFLDQLAAAGVDVAVANAVGDRAVTAWWARRPWRAVQEQLRRIRAGAESAHGVVATSAAEARQAFETGRVAVVLGLEGGDCIGMHLSRLDDLYRQGVRMMVPVHLRNNYIGTTCLPWQSYVGLPHIPLLGRREGLTRFGCAVIDRMNALGMLIDVSHSDTATLQDIAKRTRHPIVASHAGARSIEDFARYLEDGEIHAVAGTGGLVGLWPYRYGGHGPIDFDALMRHATHVAGLVGAAHLCLGTDFNGVPGTMAGMRREQDVRLIAEHLRSSGFGQDEVEGVMGGNFMRVFQQVTAS